MAGPRKAPKAGPAGPGDLESTAVLLVRARDGDRTALENLASRYYTILHRFAHGRLPHAARGMLETSDLVQGSVMKALQHIDRFEPQREGAFLAYLRRILINQIRDEIRASSRRPGIDSMEETLPGPGKSPLEEVVSKEALDQFDSALAQLEPREREAVILRVEFGLPYDEIAAALGIRTANAARMYVSRAIAALAAKMRELGSAP